MPSSLDVIPEDDSISCIFEWPDRPSRPGIINPVLWWKMEEIGNGDRIDSINNNHLHLAVAVGGTKTNNAAGKVGEAIQYNGVIRDVSGATSLIDFASQMTLLGWVKPFTVGGGSQPAYMTIYLHQWTNPAWIDIKFDFKSGDLTFEWADNNGHTGSDVHAGLATNAWHFFVLIWDTGFVKFSLDNGPIIVTAAPPLVFSPDVTNAAVWVESSTVGWSILVDELALYAGAMLPVQINTLWNGGNGVTYPPP